MGELQTFHGQVVDLRRYVNVHLHHLRPFAPADRYEVWLRTPDGGERKFTVDTREMPARRGHRLSLVTSAGSKPQVLGLINRSAVACVNYVRTDPPGLVRPGDGVWLVAALVGLAVWLGVVGMALFVLAAPVGSLMAALARWVARRRLAGRVDRMIEAQISLRVRGRARR